MALRKKRACYAVVAALAASGWCPQAAAATSDFLGQWVNAATDGSGIARVVVTQAGGSRLSIHAFGACKPTECDWGVQPAHAFSEDPGSDDAQSVTADFNAGFAQKRITLRQVPGGALKLEVQTSFTDGSGRNDYAVNARLVPAAQPGAAQTIATAGPAPAESSGGFLSSVTSIFDKPAPVARAGAGASAAIAEDCVGLNPDNSYVAPVDMTWTIRDFKHGYLKFDADHATAILAMDVIAYYHFDEQCFVARPHAQMMYWKSAGDVPRDAKPGQDCVAVDPAKVVAVQTDDTWKVVDGATTLLDYGPDQAAAGQAVSVIKAYRLNRQCFAGRPSQIMSYWLAQ
jgi:hypothetical protein